MPSILFWNIAGAGSAAIEDDLPGSLLRLVSEYAPNCVVVCEMRKIPKKDKYTTMSFKGYGYVKPTRLSATPNPSYYKDDNAKRIYVFAPMPGTHAVAMVATGKSRPAINLTVGTVDILIVHAPSVTNTSKPQAEEFVAAYDNAVAVGKKPLAIFGDLNVNAQSMTRMISLNTHLSAHSLSKWMPVTSGELTHKDKSELDWALCSPAFNCKVKAFHANSHKEVQLHNLRGSDEWDGADSAINKHSDHMVAILSW